MKAITKKPIYVYIILVCIMSTLIAWFQCYTQNVPVYDFLKYYRASVFYMCVSIVGSAIHSCLIFILIRIILRESLKYSIIFKNTLFYISMEWLVVLLISMLMGYEINYSIFAQILKRIFDIVLLISCFQYVEKNSMRRYIAIVAIYFVIISIPGYAAYVLRGLS